MRLINPCTLDDKKTIMEFPLAMAAYAISTMNHEARSALPDAPVVAPPPPGRLCRRAAFTRRRLAPLKGWLAGALHQAAWAIEPDLQTVSGPGYLSAAAILADDREGDTRPGNR